MENSMLVFLILSHPLFLIFHGLKSKLRVSNTIYHLNQGFLWSKCSRFLIGMCILSHCFSIFSMDCLKDFLHFFLHISLTISLHISLLFVSTILPLISMPKNLKNSHNVKEGFKKLEWKIACLFF